jgi:Lysozyme like domain
MPLEGEELTIKEALALCWVAGFRGPKLIDSVAVMCAESGRYTEAWHDNTDENGNVLSTDRGLFQINSIHASISKEEAYDPVANATFAFQLSKQGEDFSPWAAYNSGAHEKFIDGIKEVKDADTWKSRTKLWE